VCQIWLPILMEIVSLEESRCSMMQYRFQISPTSKIQVYKLQIQFNLVYDNNRSTKRNANPKYQYYFTTSRFVSMRPNLFSKAAAYGGCLFPSENRISRVVRNAKKVQIVNTTKISIVHFYCPKILANLRKRI
jgi:hypothetical protein